MSASTTATYSQHPLVLPSLGRGSHLITPFIQSSLKKEIDGIQCGLLHLFVQHTSCALSLNENWDEDVRRDMSDALDKIVVEDKVSLGTFPPSQVFFFAHISKWGKGEIEGGWGWGRGDSTVSYVLDFYSTYSEPRTRCPCPLSPKKKILSLSQGGGGEKYR